MSDDLQPMAPEAGVDLYLDHRREEVRDKTLQSHRYRLEQFVKWCEEEGHTNLNDLTGRDLHAFRVWRREEGDLKPVSLQSHMCTLRVFLEFCESIDAVPEGLRSKVMLPSVPEEDQKSNTTLDYELADEILDHLNKYQYASREHVIFAVLWRTGMRSGGLRALDVDDYNREDMALDVRHRPDTDTPIKNGERGERMVALDDRLAQLLDDYLAGPRHDTPDEYGRDPLISTRKGRASTSTIRDTLYRLTRPCIHGWECPHDRDPDDCEATTFDKASTCPSSRSPHDVRSGAITAHLLDDVPVEIVSDRMDVSQKVLDRHYDRRSKREKMQQRRRFLRDR